MTYFVILMLFNYSMVKVGTIFWLLALSELAEIEFLFTKLVKLYCVLKLKLP